jgi:hypothetical protein
MLPVAHQEIKQLKLFIPYDDPPFIFRIYRDDECDPEDGYPFIWRRIAELLRAYALERCEDCGMAYLAEGDILTVDHFKQRQGRLSAAQSACSVLGPSSSVPFPA